VPLGADDPQASARDDLLVLRLALGGRTGQRLLEGRGPLLRRRLPRLHPAQDQLLLREELRVSAEQDVGAASRHVRGDRHRAQPPRLGDDLRLHLVVLRVQDDVLDPLALQESRHRFGLLDRHGSDEARLAALLRFDDVLDDPVPLLLLGAEHGVLLVLADHVAVRRNDHDLEVVDLVELDGLRVRGARHPGELPVHPEVVLEGDRRERLVLPLDLDAFLRLDRLVEAVAPAPSRHQAPRELVDDDDLAVLDHVVDVALEEHVRLERLVDVVKRLHVGRVVEVVDPEQVLGVLDPAVGQRDRARLLVDDVVPFRVVLVVLPALDHRPLDELRDDLVDAEVEVGRLVRRAGDDQRGPRLVDEDRVDLVDDREVVPALDHRVERELHVVAEEVEAELVVRPVGDVGAVSRLPLRVRKVVLDAADRHAQEAVDAAHPFRVAPRQVVVDGDDVDPLAGEGVQIRRQGRHERLALPRPHLGDLAGVEDEPADQLDVEVPHPEHPASGLPDDRERLREEIVEGGARVELASELDPLSA